MADNDTSIEVSEQRSEIRDSEVQAIKQQRIVNYGQVGLVHTLLVFTQFLLHFPDYFGRTVGVHCLYGRTVGACEMKNEAEAKNFL